MLFHTLPINGIKWQQNVYYFIYKFKMAIYLKLKNNILRPNIEASLSTHNLLFGLTLSVCGFLFFLISHKFSAFASSSTFQDSERNGKCDCPQGAQTEKDK
jgi:hypothetical protein